MRCSRSILVFCLFIPATAAFAGNQIYRYHDDAGGLHFTTELHSIPEKYRSEALSSVPETLSPTERRQPVLRVVNASAEYRMGNYDTRTDATRMAIEAAKRQALEQVATYLESVTEVKNFDLTRDEIRTYSAGIVTVLNQQTHTRLEDGTIVVHVDLTAQVDEDEAILAINALRDNEHATKELVSLRAETEQLRQQLDAANLTLAAAKTAEQVHALTVERQQVLNQMQADALVAQALTGYAYVTPARVQQINDLLTRARHLHPSNPHLPAVERSINGRSASSPPLPTAPTAEIQPSAPSAVAPAASQSPLATPLPQSPLATPLPPSSLATPLPQSPLTIPLPQSPLATPLPPSPLAKPLGPSPLAAPLR
jgi:hypothetical protein